MKYRVIGSVKPSIRPGTRGVTRREMQEVLLQVCVYCGMPAAGEAFKMAREVFQEGEGVG